MTRLYPYIIANGRHLMSHDWFIREQVSLAMAAGVPETVVYRVVGKNGVPTGEWFDLSQCNDESRSRLERPFVFENDAPDQPGSFLERLTERPCTGELHVRFEGDKCSVMAAPWLSGLGEDELAAIDKLFAARKEEEFDLSP